MFKRFGIIFGLLTILPALFLVYGCGNSKRESAGEAPIAAVSAAGNIQANITGAVVSATTGSLVVTFTLFDEKGSALDPADATINGKSFVIAQLGADGEYHDPIRNSSRQPTADSGGTFAGSGGTYTYAFGKNITTLPGYDATKTYTVAAYIGRTISNVVGSPFRQISNPRFDFRPDGTAATDHREIVAIDACNECHGKLTAHEGNRMDVPLCILCHNPGEIDTDTGNTIDFKAMIHKIHMGSKLPSNTRGGAYGIIGFGNAQHDFSKVVYPQMSGDTQTDNAPVDCVKCHRLGTDTNGKAYGKDVDKWKTKPSIETCTGCHDVYTFDGITSSVTVTTFAGVVTSVTASAHSGGVQPLDSSTCAVCHTGTGDDAYASISVPAVHTIPIKSSLNPGLVFSIVSATGIASGLTPSVTFTITDKTGANAVMVLGDRTDVIMGYMTGIEYDNTLANWIFGQSTVQGKAANAFSTSVTTTANADGSYTVSYDRPWYVPSATKLKPVLPPSGVVTFAVYGGKAVTIPAANTAHRVAAGTSKVTMTSTSVAINYYDIATGLTATPAQQRRQVVSTELCNVCHLQLAFHGRRTETQLCVMCHGPNLTYLAPSSSPSPGYSGNLKDFVHGIHGATTSTTVFRGVEVAEIPNDPRKCSICHLNNSQLLPLPVGVKGSLKTGTTGTSLDGTPVLTIKAACVACHENPLTATHADSKVISGSETCVVCHGTGLLMGVDAVHLPAN
ncbi:MAG: OmcA/MtrC family decaheme c-type cytochrome [Nitrospirota bacterium]